MVYVFDMVCVEVFKMKLDDVFECKDDIVLVICCEFEEFMNEYGYGIVKVLVIDIDFDIEVKNVMNCINVVECIKFVVEYDGEVECICIVVKVCVEVESKCFQGQGIVDQCWEIVCGLEEFVEVLNKVGINLQEVFVFIVVMQYYDILQLMGENVNSNLIMMLNVFSVGVDMLF